MVASLRQARDAYYEGAANAFRGTNKFESWLAAEAERMKTTIPDVLDAVNRAEGVYRPAQGRKCGCCGQSKGASK